MQSILSNTLIASAGRVLNITLGIFVTALVTRYLGLERYGLYVLLLSIGAMVQIAADFGLYLTLTREIAKHPKKEQEWINNTTSLRITLLLTLFLCGALIAFLIPAIKPLMPAFLIVACGLILQSLSQLLMGVFQQHGVVWRATVGDVTGRAVQLTGILLFPFIITRGSEFSPIIYMALMFTCGLTAAYVLHALLTPAKQVFRFRIDAKQWKRIIRTSWPLGAMLILNIIYFRIDIVMLSFFRTSDEVGLYGLAYRVIESSLFFPAMFGGMLLPRMSRLIAKDTKNHPTQQLQQGIFISLPSATLVTILLVALAKPLILFLSGKEYSAAAPLLQVLAIALFVMFLGNIFGFTLVALSKQKQLLTLYAILALCNVIANLVFIPLFGASAAAWTTVATECVAMITAGVLVFRIVPFRIQQRDIVKIIITTIATAIIAVILPNTWHVIVQAIVIFSAYIAFGILINTWRKEHISMLLSKTTNI